MRPVLRPGTHVLRRPGGQLQVGLDPSTALLLPDRPAVRATLSGLSAGVEQTSRDASMAELSRHDVLVDAADLSALLARDDVAPTAAAALLREHGPRAPDVLAARRRSRVEVRTFGHRAGSPLRDTFMSFARQAGLHEAIPRREPACAVLLGAGEPDRELVDAWTRAGTPYLLVRMTEGRAVVGPFVAPGSTACLRCVDAHCTDADPAWPLLVRQYAAASSRDQADGAPEPVDPLLGALALAWAARDVTAYVDGLQPSTWSTTVTVHERLHRLETRSWLRHPACGCSWDASESPDQSAAGPGALNSRMP